MLYTDGSGVYIHSTNTAIFVKQISSYGMRMSTAYPLCRNLEITEKISRKL